MIAQHPATIGFPSETHLFKLLFDPFTYLPQWNWQKRFEQKSWIFKHYGLKPIFLGFHSHDIWQGFERIYKLYQNSPAKVGPHNCVDYREFKSLIQQAKNSQDCDLIKVKKTIALIWDKGFYNRGGDREKIMIEKTPMHIRYADIILNYFPEARIIEVVRDVRAVCASWQARSQKAKWANKETKDIIKQWIRCIEFGEKCRADDTIADRIYRIQYEDLRSQTFFYLKEIFDFTHLSTEDSAIEEIIEKNDISKVAKKGQGEHVSKGTIGSWRNDLSESDIQLCHALAGPLLEKLGYSVTL